MSRGTDMIQAAMPFMPPDKLCVMETLAKAWELKDSLAEGRVSGEFSSCSGPTSIDMEGMLRAVREFCNERERKLIDKILNIFMIRRMMDMMRVMQSAGEKGGDMWDVLKESLSPEQREQIEMMQMMMTMMNTSEQDM